MLLSYFKLAFRRLLRTPFFSFINIFGLSLGFAMFVVLWQYTSNELECDQFHENFKNKARLVFDWRSKDDFGNVMVNRNSQFSPEFARMLSEEYDDFEMYTRLYNQAHFDSDITGDHGKDIFLSYINTNQQKITFREENFAYADPNFFNFFSIPLIEGSGDEVLAEPNSIVLSASMAKKYLGNKNAINSIILINDSVALKVTGVFEDLPHNTHLSFDALISTNRISRMFERGSDGDHGSVLYFQVKPGVNRIDLNKRIDALAKKYLAPAILSLDLESGDFDFFLQPLEDIAFSKLLGDIHKHRSATILGALRVASVVILFIAWINYLNLIIYSNGKRMKELGVRKTSGAGNFDFILQFTLESLVMNALSIFGAITFVQLTKTIMQEFLEVHLPSGGGLSITAIGVIVITTLSGITITGIYPALNVMKRSARKILADSHTHDFNTGRWLTVFQFSVAIILTISVFAIFNQVNFVLNRDLGIRRDEVIVFDLPDNPGASFSSKLNTFMAQLSSFSEVSDFAVSSSVPGDNNENNIGVQRHAGSVFIGVDTNGGVDERFIPMFNIKLLAGRNFINGDPINDHAIILSRIVLQRLGLGEPENAVGQVVLVESKGWTHDMRPTEIIGVVEDYKRKPFLSDVTSVASNETGVALTYYDNVDAENTVQKVSMIVNHETFQETVKHVETLFHQSFSNSFFHWYFLEDNVNQHYKHEKITRNQVTLFALLATIIACLGLLGMIANKAEGKTKEIGIRKTLGADVYQIVQILLNTTINQIAIAALVGIPIAHFLVQAYLQNFTERIEIQWWHYFIPVLTLLIILFVTVASTVTKAARTNPVDSLRYE